MLKYTVDIIGDEPADMGNIYNYDGVMEWFLSRMHKNSGLIWWELSIERMGFKSYNMLNKLDFKMDFKSVLHEKEF